MPETFVPFGATINGKHTFTEYGLYFMEQPKIGSPAPKTSQINIAGTNGILDLTSAYGEITYSNRQIVLNCGAMVESENQPEFCRKIMTDIHGQTVDLVFDNDPDWAYSGRATVEFDNVQNWRLGVNIAIDANPYKVALEDTVEVFDMSEASSLFLKLADNTSAQDWNSDFRFGTKVNPTGNFELLDYIEVQWTRDSPTYTTKFIQVVDAHGAVANYSLIYLNNYDIITVEDMISDGLDVTKIIRVLVSGIGNCTIRGLITNALKKTVQNTGKTVIPAWYSDKNSDEPIKGYVNGKFFQFGTGTTRLLDITFVAGANEVTLAGGNFPGGVIPNVTATFRKGSL